MGGTGSCGGCEAETPTYKDGEKMGPGTDAKYNYDPIEGIGFEGGAGTTSYGVEITEMDVDTINGTCDDDCAEDTSCNFAFTIWIEVTIVGDTDPPSEPAFFFTPPYSGGGNGGGQQPITQGIPTLVDYDPEFGVYTHERTDTYTDDVDPGCGPPDVEFTLTDEDFAIDTPTSGAWTKAPTDNNEEFGPFKFSCAKCDGNGSKKKETQFTTAIADPVSPT